MPLHPLVGHQEARRHLARAAAQGTLPQVLLITGPPGVGKQRLGLWLAQLVLCPNPREGEPCGQCPSCHRVLGLSHPDLHWMIPIPRPKASDPDKATDEAEEAIGQAVAERRANPLYEPPDGMASHGVASARWLLRRTAKRPVEARGQVFLVGQAERLVPQESSPEAANALLKVLEEPPSDSWIILTAEEPRRLLPTVRSRAVPVRLGRLSDTQVSAFLRAEMKPSPSENVLRERVVQGAGSIGRALSAEGDTSQAFNAAAGLLEAVTAGQAPRMERALAQGTYQARGDFTALLDAVSELLAETAREALGQPGRRPVPRSLRQSRPEALTAALARVAEARDAAQGNVNPQLLLAVLSEDLAEVL